MSNGGKVSKMLGCRVPVALDQAIRERAENESRSVNDVMVEILKQAFNGSPETKKAAVTHKATDVAQAVKELKSQIRKLEESDSGGFLGMFRDEDIQSCIEALQIEIEELIETLPKRVKEVDDESSLW